MDTQKLPQQIEKLRALRVAIAERNRTLAEREIAPFASQQTPDYKRDTIRITYERDLLNAEAEAARFEVEIGVEHLKASFVGAL